MSLGSGGRAHHDHSEVKQGQMKARDRGFVASMLGANAGEHFRSY